MLWASPQLRPLLCHGDMGNMGSTCSRGTWTPLGTGNLTGVPGESMEGKDCLPSIPLLLITFLGLKGFL